MENRFFSEIKGNFGFGCMRLPTKDGSPDYETFTKMADAFIAAGFNYFDTAHGYHNGMSETAFRDCVAKRYDRKDFLITDKLTDPYFKEQKDIRPFFDRQLEWCGVDYFDFYLMHAQGRGNYEKFQRCRAYETCLELKDEGLIRHFGISFHDKAEVLDRILTDHPEIEAVQIQLNYADMDDTSVDSRNVYDVCVRHGKPVIVMEPVKGGNLARLPQEADSVLRSLGPYSNAGYALRFAGSFGNVAMVLSGMSNMDHMNDSISAMRDFSPLSAEENRAMDEVRSIFRRQNLIQCTACRYCIEENHCPKDIMIPDMFSALNSNERFKGWNSTFYYDSTITAGGHGKASDCIGCGKCEKVCPQHLPIRELLGKVAERFEHK